MQDPRDVTSFAVGALTAGIGGISLAQVQTMLGVIAAVSGIALTAATALWRYREHQHRMGKPSEKERKP